MKKRKIIFPAIAGLALAIGATSCSSNEEASTNPTTPEEKDAVSFDKAFLGSLSKYNEEKIESEQEIDEVKDFRELTSNGMLAGYSISPMNSNGLYADQELIAVENESEFAVYSTQLEKIIIGPYAKNEVSNFEIIKNPNFKTCKITFLSDEKKFDRYGNLVPDKMDGYTYMNMDTKFINRKPYFTFIFEKDDTSEEVRKNYTYDSNHKLNEIDALPEAIDEKYDGPKLNETFMSDKYDLSKYGSNAYVNVSTSSFSIFEENILKKTINLAGNENGVLVGSKLIIQKTETATKEDYNCILDDMYSSVKVKVTSRIIDLLTLEEKEADLEYALSPRDLRYLTDSEGKTSFVYLKAVKLSKNPGGLISIVIDENGNEVYNAQNERLDALIKVGDSYYNSASRHLYDKDMNLIATLWDYDVNVDKKNNLLICNYNGNWGVIGSDGKVKVEFKYDNLAPLEYQWTNYNGSPLDIKDNCIIASIKRSEDTNEYYRVNLLTGEETYLGDTLNSSTYYDDLYTFKIDSVEYYISQSKDYLAIDTSEYDFTFNSVQDKNTNIKYGVIILTDSDGNYKIYKLPLNNPDIFDIN